MRPRLLLVEDDEILAEEMIDALTDSKWDVFWAQTPEAAFHQIDQKGPPAFVLTDHDFGGYSLTTGSQVATWCATRGISVAIYTGHPVAHIAQRVSCRVFNKTRIQDVFEFLNAERESALCVAT